MLKAQQNACRLLRVKTLQPFGRKPFSDAPPPVAPKKSGGVFLKLVGVTTLGLGGAVGYAWYDEGFKKKITDNVPYSNEVFEQVFHYLPKERPKLPPMPSISMPDIPFLKKDTSRDPLESNEVIKPIKKDISTSVQTSSPKESLPVKVIKTQDSSSKTPLPEAKMERKVEEVKPKPVVSGPPKLTAAQIEAKLKSKEVDDAAENAALESILKDVLRNCTEATEQAISAQSLVREATEDHSDLMRKAMEDPDLAQKNQQWLAVTRALDAKNDAKKTADKLTANARKDVEYLRNIIADGKDNVTTKGNKTLITAQTELGKMEYDLNTTLNKVNSAESVTKMLNDYKDLIEKGKKQLRKELESVAPSVTLGSKGKKMTEEELNSLIAHAHRRIEQLQRQVAEQLALKQKMVDDALEKQKKEDEHLARQLLDVELQKQRSQFDVQKQIWEGMAREQMEQDLHRQLARQAAAHSEHIADVLRIQRKELLLQHEEQLREQLVSEHVRIQKELDGWIQRLKGIETAVEGRAEQEKIGRKAQELWLACQTLQKAVAYGKADGSSDEDNLKPLANELMAVQDAGNNHPFVNQVIRAVPEEAVQRGVWTEEELSKRFERVRKVCRRVSMIDESGGSLLRYFVSYLQSLFVVEYAAAIDLSDDVNSDDLDTFKILASADRCLRNGDLAQAVRFMNQLKGEPRRVASGWLEEAILLLETQQAAQSLLGHASARGLGSLF